MARDLGERLGCGAFVSALRRISVGPFHVNQAVTLLDDAETARSHIQPLAAAVDRLPAISMAPETITRLRQGQRVRIAEPIDSQQIAVLNEQGELVAIARPIDGGSVLQPARVIPA